jgi:FkbM family methyltransferase
MNASNPSVVSIHWAGKSFPMEFSSETDHIAGTIRHTGGFYEAEMLEDARSRLFFPQRAVDVGAHVGNHTLYFASVLGMETHAFEPNAGNFALLQSNVAKNGIVQKCHLRNAAVGARQGRARSIEDSASNSGMAKVELDPDGEVPMVTLDDEMAGLTRVDVVKIDVEGGEFDVLKGATGLLQRTRPLLYVEIMEPALQGVQAYLQSSGYVCWKRFNATPTFLFLPRERLSNGNGAPEP